MRRNYLNKSFSKWFMAVAVVPILAIVMAGCSNSTSNTASALPSTASTTASSSASDRAANLSGAGATFPQPLYAKWFDIYNQQFGIQINYQGIGSGAGIQQITAGTVDFGASDAIMNPGQQAAAEAAGGPILHIPMTSGAVAIIYNLSGIHPARSNSPGTSWLRFT